MSAERSQRTMKVPRWMGFLVPKLRLVNAGREARWELLVFSFFVDFMDDMDLVDEWTGWTGGATRLDSGFNALKLLFTHSYSGRTFI